MSKEERVTSTKEIAQALQEKLQGARLVEVRPYQSTYPGYILVFEDAEERRAYLTIAAMLQSHAGATVEVQALINTALGEFIK